MRKLKPNNFYIKPWIGWFFLMAAISSSCKSLYNTEYPKPDLVDTKPARSIQKLHKALFYVSKEGFAVGQQDATSYGIGWKHWENPDRIRSDANEITGDFTAVSGFDLGDIEHNAEHNLDGVPFNIMRELIIDAYKKGGIITISWHTDNPVSDGDSWDKTPAVAEILAGGKTTEKFELWVERLAGFIKTLRYRGRPIPIIFRPYHEMNGSWFWWGETNCSTSDYIKLWRKTVVLLRDKYKLHNILYAYSPNKLAPSDDYLKYYPGDDYVDILGVDIYDFNNAEDYKTAVAKDLALVKSIAEEKNKLFAFTETGLEKVQTPDWFTSVLYPVVENSGIAWVLFWRNSKKSHHYLPYKGHMNETDFKRFEAMPKTMFLKDISKLNY
ncbi:beta-mannosidase [Fulvivirga sp. 29W222]|uniref:Mannan endo-1,4-beta-mannosidase n=1 Tax=Fulvivirga marina TaxID=2494733 RepID=A0A937G0K3_9BACT|nr:glycosyl hydrolase [Fulvivirga marina]MBL6447936.1 beta-mannosidase [Fulvivirga marina]